MFSCVMFILSSLFADVVHRSQFVGGRIQLDRFTTVEIFVLPHALSTGTAVAPVARSVRE